MISTSRNEVVNSHLDPFSLFNGTITENYDCQIFQIFMHTFAKQMIDFGRFMSSSSVIEMIMPFQCFSITLLFLFSRNQSNCYQLFCYTLYQVESWLGQIQVPLTGKTKLVSDPKEWTNLWSLWKVSFELLSTNYIHYNVRCMNENRHCLLFAWLLALHHHSLHSRNENLKRFYSDDRIHFKQLNNSSKRNTNQSNVISNNCRKWNYLHK